MLKVKRSDRRKSKELYERDRTDEEAGRTMEQKARQEKVNAHTPNVIEQMSGQKSRRSTDERHKKRTRPHLAQRAAFHVDGANQADKTKRAHKNGERAEALKGRSI